MQRTQASPHEQKCDRPSCWESPCRYGPCPKDPDPNNVLVYGIPKFFGDREMRHIVGITEKSRKRVLDSPDLPDSLPGTPDRRHRSDSEGPEPSDAPPVTLSHGFCYYCSQLVARDSDWGRDGDIYHHLACYMKCHGPTAMQTVAACGRGKCGEL